MPHWELKYEMPAKNSNSPSLRHRREGGARYGKTGLTPLLAGSGRVGSFYSTAR
ncbi:MAG: hypothetical protein U9R04_06100 [Chloroflexota bacterium]|nr:hypothetical protein [Chloroflexota bacterium]